MDDLFHNSAKALTSASHAASLPAPANLRTLRMTIGVAALLYPVTLVLLHGGGAYLAQTGAGEKLAGVLLVALAAGLVYGVPIAGFVAARKAGADMFARQIAHLVIAAPPLFVVLGVFFYMLNIAHADYVAWAVLWIGMLAVASGPGRTTSIKPAAQWLRVAHGFCGVAILVAYLGWHLSNHMTAIWSLDLNRRMMDALRIWYRSDVVQPVLVALVTFQLVSGLRLLLTKISSQNDIYASIQTATAGYLLVFIASHLTAVFILGRVFLGIDTNFAWASGAPTGLLLDAWNVRLIPHYSLAVLFLIAHLAMGLRAVLLAHGANVRRANGAAWTICLLGLALSAVITTAQLRVHF
jgi:hypothetical protein